jgi:hypothetical protein
MLTWTLGTMGANNLADTADASFQSGTTTVEPAYLVHHVRHVPEHWPEPDRP